VLHPNGEVVAKRPYVRCEARASIMEYITPSHEADSAVFHGLLDVEIPWPVLIFGWLRKFDELAASVEFCQLLHVEVRIGETLQVT
jgi:hypothetical protein